LALLLPISSAKTNYNNKQIIVLWLLIVIYFLIATHTTNATATTTIHCYYYIHCLWYYYQCSCYNSNYIYLRNTI